MTFFFGNPSSSVVLLLLVDIERGECVDEQVDEAVMNVSLNQDAGGHSDFL